MAGVASRIRDTVLSRNDLRLLYVTRAGSGTPEETLDKLEREIDAVLPNGIRAFYLDTLEFGLAWRDGAGKNTAPEERVEWNKLCNMSSEFWKVGPEDRRDYSSRGGIIAIPPAAEVFRKGFWIDRIIPTPAGEMVELDGRELTDSAIYQDLYPFDFADGYRVAGLWFDRPNKDWRVILSSDHGACWTDYSSVGVDEYLAQLERGLGGPRQWFLTSHQKDKEYWALEAET